MTRKRGPPGLKRPAQQQPNPAHPANSDSQKGLSQRGKGPDAQKDEQKDGEKDEAEVCFICAEEIEWYGLGKCNHRTCHLCLLRFVALYKKKDCPFCKSNMDSVLFTRESSKPYESFNLKGMPFDKKLGIHFDDVDVFEATKVLLRYNCPDKHCPETFPGGWNDLKHHVKSHHNLLLCELCTRNKKLFSHENALFTSDSLKVHMANGDPDDPSFKGHPECTFCCKRFYGSDELYNHCREHHEQCFLCQRDGIRDQYFMNYPKLEAHFHNDHHPCFEKDCLEKKFVVFGSEMDLKGHELEFHSSAKVRAKGIPLTLDFASSSREQREEPTREPRQGGNEKTRRVKRQVPDGFGAQLSSQIHSNEGPEIEIPSAIPSPVLGTHNPTPAELYTPAPSQIVLSGDPDLVKSLEKIFNSSAESLERFRSFARAFKSNEIDAPSFLKAFMDIIKTSNPGKFPKELTQRAGVVWRKLSENLPPESDSSISQTISQIKGKRKKGISLAEFEEIRKAQPKKTAMVSAWNDFKASADFNWTPVSSLVQTAASVVMDGPSFRPASPSIQEPAKTSPIEPTISLPPNRVLSIKSVSNRNANSLHFPNSKSHVIKVQGNIRDTRALLSGVPSSSTSTRKITFATSPASSPPPPVRDTPPPAPFVPPVNPIVSVNAPPSSSRGSNYARNNQSKSNEAFPSLPAPTPKKSFGKKGPKPEVSTAWGSSELDDFSNLSLDSESKKKGKNVVMRWG